jgi:hypothetical protein
MQTPQFTDERHTSCNKEARSAAERYYKLTTEEGTNKQFEFDEGHVL